MRATYVLSALAALYWGFVTVVGTQHYVWVFTKDPAQDPVIAPPHLSETVIRILILASLFLASVLGPWLLRKSGRDGLALATSMALLGAALLWSTFVAYNVWTISPSMELIANPA